MKKVILIAIIALCTTKATNAQVFKKLKQEAAEKLKQKVEQKKDQKLDEKADKVATKVVNTPDSVAAKTKRLLQNKEANKPDSTGSGN